MSRAVDIPVTVDEVIDLTLRLGYHGVAARFSALKESNEGLKRELEAEKAARGNTSHELYRAVESKIPLRAAWDKAVQELAKERKEHVEQHAQAAHRAYVNTYYGSSEVWADLHESSRTAWRSVARYIAEQVAIAATAEKVKEDTKRVAFFAPAVRTVEEHSDALRRTQGYGGKWEHLTEPTREMWRREGQYVAEQVANALATREKDYQNACELLATEQDRHDGTKRVLSDVTKQRDKAETAFSKELQNHAWTKDTLRAVSEKRDTAEQALEAERGCHAKTEAKLMSLLSEEREAHAVTQSQLKELKALPKLSAEEHAKALRALYWKDHDVYPWSQADAVTQGLWLPLGEYVSKVSATTQRLVSKVYGRSDLSCSVSFAVET